MSVLTGILNLSDSAGQDEITVAVQEIIKDRDRVKAENATLTDAIDRQNREKAEARKADAVRLTDEAIRDGRIDAKGRDGMLSLFDKDFDSAKAMLDAIPRRRSVSGQLSGDNGPALGDLKAKSWDELDRAGKLLELKDKAPEIYKEKFKERFGVEPSL